MPMPARPLVARGGALLLLALLAAVTTAAAAGAARAATTGSSVLVTQAVGPVTPVFADHLDAALEAAVSGGHEALLVEMDTPGGLDPSMRDVVQRFLTAPVPVIVYVAPPGARAASAGAVIALSAHVAAMAPGTNIGAATPVALEGGEVIDKVIEDAAAYVAAIAEERDRNVEFAEDMVREGRSAPASEALELDVIDLVAADRAELLDELDGRTVVLDAQGGEVELRTADAEVVPYEMSTIHRLLQTIADPNLAFLFLSLGTLAILYEVANPGGGLGGIAGAILIILAFFALAVLPVDLVGVVLLVLAVGLFVAELFVPGIGVFAAGGTVALVLAGLFLFQRPTGIAVDWWAIFPLALLVGGGAVVVGRIAWRSRNAPAYEGVAGTIVGATGRVRSFRGDTPQVLVEGALWSARSDTELIVGQHVQVVDRDGLHLVVQPTEPAEPVERAEA